MTMTTRQLERSYRAFQNIIIEAAWVARLTPTDPFPDEPVTVTVTLSSAGVSVGVSDSTKPVNRKANT